MSEFNPVGAPPPANDPETLAKGLEAELIAQRATWAQQRARRGLWRGLSLLFLLLVVLGAVAAYLYFTNEVRPRAEAAPGHARVEPDR